MNHVRHDLPLFYLTEDDAWPKSRRGSFLLAVMSDAAQRRFGDMRCTGIPSTYRFTRLLPSTDSMDPADMEEVARILEWHHPGTYIQHYDVDDMDENAPSGVLVRRWTGYDLDDADWQRARDIEVECRTRTEVQLREFDKLLNEFAHAAFTQQITTFTITEKDGTLIPIPHEFWDVDTPVLRARHALGLYNPDDASSRRPRGTAAIFVGPKGLHAWFDNISPISTDDPPNLDRARAYLADIEGRLQAAAFALRKHNGDNKGALGVPGGKNTLFIILKNPPFNLSIKMSEDLIRERSAGVFRKRGRPADGDIASEIIKKITDKHIGTK